MRGNSIAATWNKKALVQTAEENSRAFSKREVESAKRAADLLSRMGYPPIKKAIEIVENGSNFNVTGHDFRVAEAIWGKDIASLKGRTTKKPSTTSGSTVKHNIVQLEQTLSVDIMFIEGVLPALIGVTSPLDLTLAVSLTSFDTNKASRSADEIKKGITEMISTLRSRNFFIVLIMSDGEEGVGKIKAELNALGVTVDISGAGGHVTRVERRIRMINERIRSHISWKLPYSLTGMGITMLILFCVSRINFQGSRRSEPKGTIHRQKGRWSYRF